MRRIKFDGTSTSKPGFMRPNYSYTIYNKLHTKAHTLLFDTGNGTEDTELKTEVELKNDVKRPFWGTTKFFSTEQIIDENYI